MMLRACTAPNAERASEDQRPIAGPETQVGVYYGGASVELPPGRGPGCANGTLVLARLRSSQAAVTAAPAPTTPTPVYIQRAIGENSAEAKDDNPLPAG